MTKKSFKFMVFVFLLNFVLTSCTLFIEKPEQAVINALNALKSSDWETARKYVEDSELLDTSSDSENDNLIQDEESINLILNKLSFKVISSAKKGNTATVKTEITNTDMSAIMGEYLLRGLAIAFQNSFAGENEKSEEEKNAETKQIFIDLLNREDNKTRVSTVDIKLSRHENSWKIDVDEEFQDAVLGGLVTVKKDLEKSFNSWQESSDSND
ncbi:hypothetical protein ABCY62_00950 [Acetivibrio clariflavus]|uniref:hypothetical protein n=1 Tax=Acetivibrio clariflavus TaxID=288965 RepID=UPI0031F573FC